MARRVATLALLAVVAVSVAACGSSDVKVAKSDPTHTGAVLFAENCGGCHSLRKAGTQGSTADVRDKERTDGPNFDQRKEQMADVLYAIRNGGFSGAIMPENIVTGKQAQAIAAFLAKYSGSNASQK